MVNDLNNPFQSPLVTRHGHEVSFVITEPADRPALPAADSLILTNKFTGVRTRLGDEYLNAFNQAVKTYAIATGARAEAEEVASRAPQLSSDLKARYYKGFEPYQKVNVAMNDMADKLAAESIGGLDTLLYRIDNLAEGREQLRFAAPQPQEYNGTPDHGLNVGRTGGRQIT